MIKMRDDEETDFAGRGYYYLPELDTDENTTMAPFKSSQGDANLLSSKDERFPHLHHPVIDLDGIGVRLVPSTTLGNYHLYINKAVQWTDYIVLLKAFEKAGLVQSRWVEASIARGASFVRPEGVLKPAGKHKEYK